MAIVGKTLFGTDTEADSEQITAAVQVATKGFKTFNLPAGQLLERILIPQKRRFELARATLERFMERLLAERRQSGGDRGDLVSMLLSAQEEDTEGLLTNVQVRDEALTVFLAGYETMSQALTWTWYLLSQHPEVEARLHHEIDGAVRSRLPTPGDMPHLPYTEKVFREAMRIYPPVWRVMRRAIEDYQAGAYTIRAGSIVLLCPYTMHRAERYYAEPARFDPERWTDDARRLPEFSYFPFGGGPRRCIGEGFACMEGILVLATLAQHWRLRLPALPQVSPEPVIMLRPKNGLRMVAERREPASISVPHLPVQPTLACPHLAMSGSGF